jgi:NADPH2:quinone reductase
VKAVWYEQIGAADEVLRHDNIDNPEVSDGEVLVRIRTSGVNPSDVKTRGGARGELQFPRIIPHSDGAGKIEAVGNGVDKNRIGERVWLWNGAFGRAFGTCAEYISLPANQAVEMPENTTFEAGACMGIPASTAYHGVFSGGSVKNKTVLVTGGAGAVGHYAIQLAKWDGAQVITTVSGPEKGLAAEEAGADLVVNYKTDDVVEAVNNFTNAEGVDRIVEVEFGGNLSVSEQIIKTNGVIAAYGSVAVGNPELPFYNLMFKNAVLKMYLIYIVPGEARMKIIEGLTKALSENALVHQIAKSFDLTDTIQAHKTVEAGKLIGNTVINLA